MQVLGKFEAIDLTHPLNSSVPTWRGNCGFSHEVKMDYHQGLRILSYRCQGGIGTHLDAPAHFFKEGASIAEIPLEQLIVPVCVLHLSEKMDPDFFVMPEDILEYEKTWGEIESGSLVLASTGWEKYWDQPEAYRNEDENGKKHFPGFHVKTAQILLERGIVGIGIDTFSPDGCNNTLESDFPVHQVILGAGKYIIENVANLAQMPAKGAFALVMPIKIEMGVEAPIRLVGLINKQKG
jgi:kynurenine formamidase